MSHIFISYSRKDKDLAQRIVTALADNDLDTWVDWNSIPKGEDWLQEIYRGIEGADAFLFLISEDSVISEPCNAEIAHAVKNGKRILPVFIADVENKDVYNVTDKFANKASKDEINRRNFIFCRDEQDDFAQAIAEIHETIHTDYEWVRIHTNLQIKAKKWEEKQDNSRLLHGKELKESVETFSKFSHMLDPVPTELQKNYLEASKKQAKRTRTWTIIGILTLIGSIFWLFGLFISKERPVPGAWVSIPAGSFTMGMDEEEANYSYNLFSTYAESNDSESYFLPDYLLTWSGKQEAAILGEYQIMDNEVSNAQYQQCVDNEGCEKSEGWIYEEKEINYPATNLNWFEAEAYCQWLGGRLPTEAEWEKAARGIDNTSFPWGNTWEAGKSNLQLSGKGSVLAIDEFSTTDISSYFVKNLAGNVQEWTSSDYVYLGKDQLFQNEIVEIPDDEEYYPVIVRGGAWNNVSSVGIVSNRAVDVSGARRDVIGFRCVCPNNMSCSSPWDFMWVWFGK